MQLTPDEKKLYALLTVEIARSAGGEKGEPVWMASRDSCFEWGAWILRELGFATLSQADGTPVPAGQTGPYYHLLQTSVDEITQSFRDGTAVFAVPLGKLLEVFIQLTGYFDPAIGKLPAAIRPFAISDYYRQIMPAFVQCGYAEISSATKYAWTDKIGPAFRASGVWPAATIGQTRAIWEKKSNKDKKTGAELMLDTMPRRIKKKLYMASRATFSRVIAEHWYDDQWNTKARRKHKDYDVLNAKTTLQLMKHIEDQGGIG